MPPLTLVSGFGRRSSIRAAGSLVSAERHFSSQPRTKETNTKDGEPWWSLSSLHKRVATVLATSLPDSYRSDLHKSLSASLNEEDSHKSHSINEAIVSAQAREASAKHKSSSASSSSDQTQLEWLKKQKKLEEEIEQRALEKAQERIQLELVAMQEQMKRQEEEQRKKIENEMQRKIVFEQWQSDVQKERERDSHTKQGKQQSDTLEKEAQTHREAEIHPILGKQLADLSYKRIHLMSASTLASLPVYEKQRAYRHDRAQVMAKDKKKTLWMGLPGVISLAEDESGKLAILDGQHRVGMLALLTEEQRKLHNSMEQNGYLDDQLKELAELDLQSILVEVFPQRPRDETVLANDKDLDDKAIIFTEINKAEPIKLLDLPGIANKQTRNIIDYAGKKLAHRLNIHCYIPTQFPSPRKTVASHFHDSFPAMFSPSQKCRAPHLNLDNLRDALFASEIITREGLGSGGELVKFMTKKNLELKVKYTDTYESQSAEGSDKNGMKSKAGAKVSESALKKAQKHDFYLGLEATWLYK